MLARSSAPCNCLHAARIGSVHIHAAQHRCGPAEWPFCVQYRRCRASPGIKAIMRPTKGAGVYGIIDYVPCLARSSRNFGPNRGCQGPPIRLHGKPAMAEISTLANRLSGRRLGLPHGHQWSRDGGRHCGRWLCIPACRRQPHCFAPYIAAFTSVCAKSSPT